MTTIMHDIDMTGSRQGPTTPRLPSNIMDRCASADAPRGSIGKTQSARSAGATTKAETEAASRRESAGPGEGEPEGDALGGGRDEAGWRRPMRPKGQEAR